MSNMKQKTDKKTTKKKVLRTVKNTVPAVENGLPNDSKKKATVRRHSNHEQSTPSTKVVRKSVAAIPSNHHELDVKFEGVQSRAQKRKAEVELNHDPKSKIEDLSAVKKFKATPAVKSHISRTTVKKQKELLKVPKLSTLSGVLFVIGMNEVGQLGLGEDVTVRRKPTELNFRHLVDIAAGGMHSVCLTDKGEVYTFGCNDEGALGRKTDEEEDSFVPQKVDINEIVVQVSAGDSHSAALTDKGHVFIWGNFKNNSGAMGLTSPGVRQQSPTRILNGVTVVSIASGSEHLVCLSEDGIVYTCGCGEAGQLGRITERCCTKGGRKGLSRLLEPGIVTVTSKKSIVENIWTGSYSTFLKLQKSGDIYAFGLNNYNQLGYEPNTRHRKDRKECVTFMPQLIPSFRGRSWNCINGGQHHTLALDNLGQVYSFGRKEYGRLGLGENCDDQHAPTAIPSLQKEHCSNISCGNVQSFAVSERGLVYSWGMGDCAQLGHGNEDDCHVPTLIESLSESWHVFKVSGGGQHTLILANRKATTEKKKK